MKTNKRVVDCQKQLKHQWKKTQNQANLVHLDQENEMSHS